MNTGIFLLVVLLGGGLVFLALRLNQASLGRKTLRARYFDLVAPAMAARRQAIAATGFARVSGRIGGVETDLQVVPDTLTYRKLPTLWLLVTQPGPVALRQRIHLMIRPRGVEPFSAFDTLPHQTILPPDFPLDAALRSDLPLSPEEAALIQRQLHLFRDQRLKELVLSPKGLRLTWLADEAQRGHYLIFREAEMGREPLTPQALEPLLTALEDLHADIATARLLPSAPQAPIPERKCA